jgi:manganese/zinc/iron transport system permease protein
MELLTQILQALSTWCLIDTWMVVMAALVAMACAIPGSFLVLRRQSLLADGVSHAALPGVVVAFLLSGLFPAGSGWSVVILLAGAAVSGILASVLIEQLQRLRTIHADTALGIVFTTLFAVGLLLLRTLADRIHLDPACIVFGNLEVAVVETFAGTSLPIGVVVALVTLVLNLTCLLLFYKELLISTFDTVFAESIGIAASRVQLLLAVLVAVTIVGAFQTVGSLLVLGMLVIPPATARLLTHHFPTMILLSMGIGLFSAVMGHILAISLVGPLLASIGMGGIEAVSTSGMMVLVASGCLLLALLLSPEYGALSRLGQQMRTQMRIAEEDLLAVLYRLEEAGRQVSTKDLSSLVAESTGQPAWRIWAASRQLIRRGAMTYEDQHYVLTEIGRQGGRQIVRAHRLWETFLAQRLGLRPEQWHDNASRAEHYISSELRHELSNDLMRPDQDPQGRQIPPES